ncbi:MAG: hypothetical protein ACRD43_15445 [Pyrinomonadaceae bacterium]
MNRIKNIFSVLAFSAALFALPLAASAQWNGGNYPNNGGYGYPNGGYPNGNYPNNGSYGNYGGDMRGTVESLHNQAKSFKDAVNHMNSRYRDPSIKNLARDFEDATKDLKNNYRNGNGANDAQRVLSIASQIDGTMGYNNGGNHGNGGYGNRGGYRGGNGLEGQWGQMRGDIQAVADAYGNGGYNNPGYNPGYRNNRNNGVRRNRLPFPLPF